MTSTPPRALRVAAALFSAFALLLMAEALWIALGARWFRSAQAWAALHPPGTLPKQFAASFAMFAVVWFLMRGRRWAWIVLLTWASLVGIFGFALLLAAAMPSTVARAFIQLHPIEAISGSVAWMCALAGLAHLLARDARAYCSGAAATLEKRSG